MRLLEPPELENLEDLLEIERLPHIDHPDRAVDAELLELSLRQREILGRIERGAVRAQNRQRAVDRLGQSELFVDLDDRQPIADLGESGFDQLLDDLLARLFDFAFEEPDIEMRVQLVEDAPEVGQAPFARRLPERDQRRLLRLPARERLAHFVPPSGHVRPPVDVAVELFPAVEPLARGHVRWRDPFDLDIRLFVFQLEPQLLSDDRPELENRAGRPGSRCP